MPTDTDGDGCSANKEAYGALWPNPGSTCSSPSPCYSDSNWYDFYDVPVPANADPTANGPKDHALTMGDVFAVLVYVGTRDNGAATPNGVDYDSVKGSCDWNGDTTPDEEGLCYDRSVTTPPNPPWEVGPPDTAITLDDVLAALAQVGLSCWTQ
jgi:hypothetical protein